MGEFVCLFMGIAVLFSGNDVGVLANNNILPIVLYCLGAFLIVIGLRLILNRIAEERKIQEDKRYDEIKNAHTELNNTINESVKVIHDDLSSIKEIINITNEQLAGDIEALGGQNDVQVKAVLAAIAKSTEDVNNVINSSSNETCNIAKELSVKFEGLSTQIVEPIAKLPEHIVRMLDEIKQDINEYLDENKTLIEDLTNEIEKRDENSATRCEEVISSIEDSTISNNEDLKIKIATLSKQYEGFEATINAIVNQMTEMSDKDYELMKGFLK